jgi:hypothetical protein
MPLSPVRLEKVFRYAIFFDGVDDVAVVPYSPLLDITDNLTVLAFFMTIAPIPDQKIVSKYPGVPQWMLGIYDSRAYTELWTAGGGYSSQNYIGTFRLGRWHQYGISYRSSDGYYTVYLDGERAGTISTDGWPLRSSTGNTVIGSSTDTNGLHLLGLVSQVLVYARVLSDDEVMWNYNNFEDPVSGSLRLSLFAHPDNVSDIDNDGILEWIDLSGHGNHGKLYGARLITLIKDPARVLTSARALTPAR